MNIFSNIGITELIVVLLIALIVVGPERLPEMGRKLAETLRSLRKAYENLTRDLGPELMSLQQTTQELRDSVDSVRSIPQDMIQSVVKAADLDDTLKELEGVTGSIEQVGQTMSAAGQIVKNPVGAAMDTAREALLPTKPKEAEEGQEGPQEVEPASATEVVPAASDPGLTETAEIAQKTKKEEPQEAELAAATEAAPASDDMGLIETTEMGEKAGTEEPKEPETTIDAPEERAHD